uniref:Uncharacterized protein n=1 Tax=viral metagenome TaxID=1070528 RepID=A0A6C0LFS6_9ZZZZ
MTRSKTIAANAAANAPVVEPEPIANETTDDNSTVLYPSMFNRWELPLW